MKKNNDTNDALWQGPKTPRPGLKDKLGGPEDWLTIGPEPVPNNLAGGRDFSGGESGGPLTLSGPHPWPYMNNFDPYPYPGDGLKPQNWPQGGPPKLNYDPNDNCLTVSQSGGSDNW